MTTTPEIDFSQWTDAQLEVGLRFESSPNFSALKAEHDRRQAAGSDDGSRERVASFAKSVKRTRRAPR
jgi:hypothetical protein